MTRILTGSTGGFLAMIPPGDAGYQADKAAMEAGTYFDGDTGSEALARTVIFSWNGNAGTLEAPDYIADLPEEGTIFRITTTKPNAPGNAFSVNTAGLGFVTNNDALAKDALDLIGVVPNPYKAASDYEASAFADKVRFVNLPARATIRVFSLDGTLIRTLEKSGEAADLDWNLQTDAGLPIASGMYIIHVEARRADGSVLGERVIKFGAIKKRVQLEAF